jgi:hypothetical protein
MSLSVPGVPAPCEKFPHSSQLRDKNGFKETCRERGIEELFHFYLPLAKLASRVVQIL